MGREFSNGFPLASLCNDGTDETRRALTFAHCARLTLSDVTDTRPVRGKPALRFGPVFAVSRRILLPALGVRLFVGASTFRLSSKRGGMDFRAILIHTLISNSKLSAIPGLPLALRPANRNRTDTAKLLTGVPYIRQIEPFI
jgi:hypothetical protein